MCGIIGIISQKSVTNQIWDSLKRLEYRGYDSSGMAVLTNGHIESRRAEGKLNNLRDLINMKPINGTAGIGHTRWATHGKPTEANAHPHATDRVAVVHNGIIENFQELRAELEKEGYKFNTETDTEVISSLLTHFLNQQKTPQQAMQMTMDKLKGAFAIAVIFAGQSDFIMGARRGSPLVIGYGDNEMYLASDALALASLSKRLCYLEDDDWAVLYLNKAEIYHHNKQITREIKANELSSTLIGKGNYRHFMLKEIYEQPTVLGDCLKNYINPHTRSLQFPELPVDISALVKINIVACGTAYLAGMVSKYWIERLTGISVEVDIASEFCYRQAVLLPNSITMAISQSGETADTLMALRYAKEHSQKIISVLNVQESLMAHESNMVLPTMAGPEIGVASTKAFITQLLVLGCFAIRLAILKGRINEQQEKDYCTALLEVPSLIVDILNRAEEIRYIAHKISEAQDVLYLGRGTSYPIALEGALKLKELSYIHAEGFAAGEMKHGPIALVDETVPVIILAPSDFLFEKTFSNIQQIIARGGKVIVFCDKESAHHFKSFPVEIFILPKVHDFIVPLIYTVPMQLLAYYTAVIKGTDVDQPRNLAKSVAVE
ncbi:MAG: glutamine--fructose-6-phosphate transaminase (isomerizing) [Alphaproteobacteria bacterium]|nr:glutamine--fructose-6-phosphate transaminase (isomerizing) [Alphaproteobacteria bacterium]